MIKLTFEHGRNIFDGRKFKPWIYKLFPSARFGGFMWANWFPTVEIPFDEFREGYKSIPDHAQKKIAGIKTEMGESAGKIILTALCFDVRPINKITNLHPDFEKHTGRESYGKYVEEVIEII